MKLVAIGDSITEGYPFGREKSWVEYLAKELKCEVINQGNNGDFTKGMLHRFERDVLSYAPTHVIILGGANDAYEEISLEQVSSNFVRMIEMCHKQGAIPILGMPTPSLMAEEERFLEDYRKWFADYATKKSIRIIDFFSPFQHKIKSGQAAEFFVDEVHPSIRGYAFMGEIASQTWNRWEIIKV
ncbi:lysophospholipase L1-like esterase [Desulfosporosinus acidiphilus SJ4]|uniref:Lysophospholipase L1-like esterase n=1 Tax=Desulfosporosinus acidiphilus (strain DSM 22704 / JCM 16185 / SJ4) TaxID=646529 RepID=I4D2M3_DESAJ|nr:GDSL-type esterase/lipase family protein [Desulfosporosinus acidiphilus]AFM40047.1 lysophospholipase L1-like esterase [Desulfosporosinus acidiphilus SJ4]